MGSDTGCTPPSTRTDLHFSMEGTFGVVLESSETSVVLNRTGRPPSGPSGGFSCLRAWFSKRGWEPFAYQERAWGAFAAGRSGLIHVPTGAGKTYAAYLGPLADLIDAARAGTLAEGLAVVYITPLRAVARDIEAALAHPVRDLRLPLVVESRTGDTASSVRARQRKRLPHVLVTTPESLSLLLTREEAPALFTGVRATIIDEWHELLSSKRGTQTELALARLRRWSPGMRTWALSATIENVDEAARCACGVALPDEGRASKRDGRGAIGAEADATIIRADMPRPVAVESLLPHDIRRFPWAGHLGLAMLDELVETVDPARSTLVFTNTRSQSERWYQAILAARPEWAPRMALHHGSIDRDERERVEAGLKDGSIGLVVCTSSLDLGVDFAPVESVVQIGSPKGVARLMQRAGRSGHRPGAPCRIVCVPTHALELIEIAAARGGIQHGLIEPRSPLEAPLDVLAQHLVTCALGGGFDADDLFDEVRTAASYRNLSRAEFDWALDLVVRGGETLRAYPHFRRVVRADDARYRLTDRRLAHLHRLNVGTITGDGSIDIRYLNGRRIGSIEEHFVSHLRPGQRFFFAGKHLEFVELRDMTAVVRASRKRSTLTPIWGGTRLPLSETLSEEVRGAIQGARDGTLDTPEGRAIRPVFDVQSRLSRVPSADETLVEIVRTREGHHLFVYPFEGRLVHAGIAALLALRLARPDPATFAISFNDYGLELLSAGPFPFADRLGPSLFDTDLLREDCIESLNLAALSRRQFREVARVSGLVFTSYPGARKTLRQLHASSSLLFDVFEQFDPSNLLLEQARRETLARQFEESRLSRTLARLRDGPLAITAPERPTPFALPLIVERLHSTSLTTESIAQRVERLKEQWLSGTP